MADIGVLFKPEMVRAQLDGLKTITRRPAWRNCKACKVTGFAPMKGSAPRRPVLCPKCRGACEVPTRWQSVKPGDRIWIRETLTRSGAMVQYNADHKTTRQIWPVTWKQDPRPSIHMPRAFSRLTWVVTAVRRERLQEISAADVLAEGVRLSPSELYPRTNTEYKLRAQWERLWVSIHGQESWDANPELVVINGTVHQCNIDKMPDAPVKVGTPEYFASLNRALSGDIEGAPV